MSPDNNSIDEYYSSLFGELNRFVYNSLYSNKENINSLLKKFSLLVFKSNGKGFSWFLNNIQEKEVLNLLIHDKFLGTENDTQLFYNKFIKFVFINSGFVTYFKSTDKDIEILKNISEEKLLLTQGYEIDYKEEENILLLEERLFYQSLINQEPFSYLESKWAFSGNIDFYYFKIFKNSVEFIGLISLDKSENCSILKKIIPFIRSSVMGAYLMKDIMLLNAEKIITSQYKSAITTILVDSFAHNVSAHALSALEWWFRQRSRKIDESHRLWWETAEVKALVKEKPENFLQALKESYNDFHRSFDKNFSETEYHYLKQYIQDIQDNKFPNGGLPASFNHVLWTLLRFLRDKAVFWSGVTRDIPKGGEIMNLYEVLWENFANNPLFLGTIIKSEGITCIKIHLGLFKEVEKGAPKQVETFADGTSAEGEWLRIDLSAIDTNHESALHGRIQQYQYIQLGQRFEDYYALMQQYKLFLPNGKVGLHALMTLIENSLRNIKHHPHYLKNKPKEIDLFLSIKPVSLMEESEDFPLYKFSIHLNPQIEYEGDKPLFEYLWDKLLKPIVNDNGVPRLGGNSQDKICAAMLLNNNFLDVEGFDSDKKEINQRNAFYYPWVNFGIKNETVSSKKTFHLPLRAYPADEPLHHEAIEKFKKSEMAIYHKELRQTYTEKEIGEGVLIKSFYIWKGETVKKGTLNPADNPSRFRFVQGKAQDFKHEVVRAVEILSNNEADLYAAWLSKWLRYKKGITLAFYSKGYTDKLKAYIPYTPNEKAVYVSVNEEVSLKKAYRIQLSHSPKSSHYEEGTMGIRSHGRFSDYFKGIDNFEHGELPLKDYYVYEMLETIFTKILIVDRRVHNRIEKAESNKSKILQKLHLTVKDEDKDDWNKEKGSIIAKYNLCIIHLTFIEQLGYNESEIIRFLGDELGFVPEKTEIENFYFVITSGRGRTEWMKDIKIQKQENIYSFVTYMPIEAVLSAIEDGLIVKDDYQTKYNLVKLFLK